MRHRPVPVRPEDRRTTPVGVTLAAAFVGTFVVVTLAEMLGLSRGWAVLSVALVVGLCGISAKWSAALAAALLGWLFLIGFVTNRFGELRLTGWVDAWPLALLVVVATVSSAASRVRDHAAGRTGGAARLPGSGDALPRPRHLLGPTAATSQASHQGRAGTPV